MDWREDSVGQAMDEAGLEVSQIELPVTEKKEPTGSDEEEEEEPEELLIDYLPWIIAAAFGLLLLIIAAALMASVSSSPLVFAYKTKYFNIPHYQGSMRVYSVDGQKLKYISNLRFIGNQISRNLRYRIEPKLKSVYSAASLPVDSVVVLAFKYGGAGEMPVALRGRSITGRARALKNEENSIVVRHWIYLNDNVTLTGKDIKQNILSTIDKVDGISVDKSSIALQSLENMTTIEAIQTLTQAGFFKHGLKGLDLQLLDVFGLSFSLQSEEDTQGYCSALSSPMYGSVSPKACRTSIQTYLQMTCEFTCEEGFVLSGSAKRICMSSGLWSGEPTRCQKMCSSVKPLLVGMIKPEICASQKVLAGQMCFLDCSSSIYDMALPRGIATQRHALWREMWPSLNYERSHPLPPKLEEFTGVKSHFLECTQDGQWSGSGGSCKAKCSKLYHPARGFVSPRYCVINPLEGDQCFVTCDSGYGIEGGTSFLTCGVSGKWSDEMPRCEILCPSLVETSNMAISPNACLSDAHEKLVCKHECDVGYQLEGVENRLCHYGSWDSPAPQCTRACNSLAHPDNGIIVSNSGPCNARDLLLGTECTLLCDAGYAPSTRSVICQATGNWSSNTLQCIKTCSTLRKSDSGSWSPVSCQTNHHLALGACTLTCATGYILQGAASLTCSSGGIWSASPGACIANCPALTAPANVALKNTECISGSATIGMRCRFSCDAGYWTPLVNSIDCTSSGWSKAIPACQAQDQVLIVQEWFDRFICLIVDDGNVKKLDNIDGSCEEENARWSIDGRHLLNIASMTCLTISQSSLLMKNCVNRDDRQRFESEMGKTLKNIASGKYVTSGYRTITQPQLDAFPRSLLDGDVQWGLYDAKLGISGESSSFDWWVNWGKCNPLTIDSNILINPTGCRSSQQAESNTCQLSCGATLALSLPSQNVATCRKGSWDIDPAITCVPLAGGSTQCDPYVVQGYWNVSVTPSTCTTVPADPNDVCSFACINVLEDYLDGPSYVSCFANGRWSTLQPPVCKSRCQSLFPLSENSHLIATDKEKCVGYGKHINPGSVCPLACHAGLQLFGESVLTCMDNGQWNAPLPTCVSTCTEMNHIENGWLENCTVSKFMGRHLAGTICSFTCHHDFYLGLPTPTVACQNPGEWFFHSFGEAKCLRKCPVFTSELVNNTQVQPTICVDGTPIIGTKCTFSCEEGFGFDVRSVSDPASNTHTRECLEGGIWSGSMQICTKRCEPLPATDLNVVYYDPPECESVSMKPGDQCKYHCQGNTAAVEGGADTLVCGEDGNWKPEGGLSECLRGCNAIPKYPYLNIMPHACTGIFIRAGTQCILSCPDHMERVGSGYRKCEVPTDVNMQSRWTGSFKPTLCVARCPPLQHHEGSRQLPRDCAYSYKLQGDECIFTCDQEYVMSGNSKLSCLSAGIWSSTVPVCHKRCPSLQLPSGTVSGCDSASNFFATSGLHGFYYATGVKCHVACNTGFTTHGIEQITCDTDGLWKPPPLCVGVSDSFMFFQKVGIKSFCLQGSQKGNDGSTDGAEWHLTLRNEADESCDTRWIWHHTDYVKHTQTGLCLTAESALEDASLLLQMCDISNKLQQWTCDSVHSYRFILKGTNLGIDSRYEQLGPVLQSSVAASSYWVSYNNVLETVATICSIKWTGMCPVIEKPFMEIEPEGCDTDVNLWTKCYMTCAEGTDFDGNDISIVCKPGGVWARLGDSYCRKRCPALPNITGGTYNSTRCDENGNIHQTICQLTCDVGFYLSNNEDYANYACYDGKWLGPPRRLNCKNRCKPPAKPLNGIIACSFTSCKIICDIGYRVEGSVMQYDCISGKKMPDLKCIEEYHFRLQLKTAMISSAVTCASAVVGNRRVKVVKTACKRHSTYQYWTWKSSKLLNVGTGHCLAASSAGTRSELMMAQCDDSVHMQQWKCHSPSHPGRIGLLYYPNSYVEVGSIRDVTPLVLRNDDIQLQSADWVAIGFFGKVEQPCAMRTSGSCSNLAPFPTVKIAPSDCSSLDVLPEATECVVSCTDNTSEQADGKETYAMKCERTGFWNDTIRLCVAKSSATGTCSPISLFEHLGLNVMPRKCNAETMQPLLIGETCTFSCEEGFYMKGVEQISCNGTNGWTDDLPECIAYCPGMLLENGAKMDDPHCEDIVVAEGTVCNKTCGEGFLPVDGSPKFSPVICDSGGRWQMDLFTCEVSCPPLSSKPFYATSNMQELQDPNSMIRTFTNEICAQEQSYPGTECKFYCGAGNVTVDGEDSVICGTGGDWRGSVPRCVEKFHCPQTIEHEHGKAFYASLLGDKAVHPGSVVKLNCSKGTRPEGDELRVCQKDGTWGGNGPATPRCTVQCKVPIPPFASEICPYPCKAGYVDETTKCVQMCILDAALEGGNKSNTVTCENRGLWSDSLLKCSIEDRTKVVKSMKVYSRDAGFLIQPNYADGGCLYAAEDRAVRWRPSAKCDMRRADNRWRWYDTQQILNFGTDLCMQPLDSNSDKTYLVLGKCNASFALGCGNPKSVFMKYMLFFHSNLHWQLDFDAHPKSGKTSSIFMEKIEIPGVVPWPDSFPGLNVYARGEGMNPTGIHDTVCSFMCGGVIPFGKSYETSAIVSPGFMDNLHYPPNTYCHWTFIGLGNIIVLALQEIDIEASADGKCSADCLKVIEGSSGGKSSNILASFSGDNIHNQMPLIIKSMFNVHVIFSSNGVKQGRGFAMKYRFEKHPKPSELKCGSRKTYDDSIAASGGSLSSMEAEPTTIKKWPWLVSIREKYYGSSKGYHRCAGVLISDSVVLSAAHCLRFTQYYKSFVDIGIGQTVQNDMNHVMRKKRRGTPQPIFHIYHGYDYASRNGDLALWKLSKPVVRSDSVSPICIPDRGFNMYEHQATCYSAGWNSLSYGTILNQLTEYKVRMISSSWCKERLGLDEKAAFGCGENINFETTGTHEKLESEPLMCEHKSVWYLVGIRSYTHIGFSGTYRLYTEIYKFADWITYTMSTLNMYSTSQGAHLLEGVSYIRGYDSEMFEEISR